MAHINMKEYFRSLSIAEVVLVAARVLSRVTSDDQRMRLSRLHFSAHSACLVELNDPAHFNGESLELMSDLK